MGDYAEDLKTDNSDKRMEGLLVDNAGANVFVAKLGLDYQSLNGEVVGIQAVKNWSAAKILTLTGGAPTPAGTDILMGGGGAVAGTDLNIRDTNPHIFQIPMSYWRHLALEILNDGNYDQDGTVSVYGYSTLSGLGGLYGALLASFTLDGNVPCTFSIGDGGAVGQGGTAGGATNTAYSFYNVPALASAWPYIGLGIVFGVAPSAGALQLAIMRKTV